MRRFLLTFAIGSSLFAGSVSAEELEVGRNGWFVGLSGAVGGAADTNTDGKSDVAGGFGARGGLRFHSLLAVEAQLEFLDNLIDRERRSDIDVWTLTANAKVYVPPWQNGQFYVLAGAGSMYRAVESSNSEDRGGFAARFGGGMEVWMTRHFLATFEASYVLPTGALDDLDYVSGRVGLQYRF